MSSLFPFSAMAARSTSITLGEVSTTGPGSGSETAGAPLLPGSEEEAPGVRLPISGKSSPMAFFTGKIMCFTSSRSMVNIPSCSTWSSMLVSTLYREAGVRSPFQGRRVTPIPKIWQSTQAPKITAAKRISNRSKPGKPLPKMHSRIEGSSRIRRMGMERITVEKITSA